MSTLAPRAPQSAIDLVILLVDDPARSASCYRTLLGVAPVEQSSTFAMFVFPNGCRLGFWSNKTVEPPATGGPGAAEVCLIDEDVDALHAAWMASGIRIAQPPTDMDFGRTFVALDPDGHRVRVFRPAPEEGADA